MRAATSPLPRAVALPALAVVAVLALLPSAAAGTQDPATYPDGILEVSNSPVRDREDFEVTTRLGAAADQVTVTVCRFASVEAAGPEVCYMNLAGSPVEGPSAWTVSTAAGEHPDWRDGWIIGYKVTARTASGELHAPDRLAANGEPDYYRLVVGEPEVEGSAVVEDVPPRPPDQGAKESPGPATAILLAVLSWAVAGHRRRQA